MRKDDCASFHKSLIHHSNEPANHIFYLFNIFYPKQDRLGEGLNKKWNVRRKTLRKNVRMPRLLIVEDNQLLREVLEADLTDQGHIVTVLDDGMAAQRALQDETFDAVIVDAVLPSATSGLDVANCARERGIPVLLTSGWPEAIVKLSTTPYHFLRKPFHPAQLKEAIRAVLSANLDGPVSAKKT
jgi:CheY-like chemotaxis protein